MKKKGDIVRKALFRFLPFETYLSLLSWGYFIAFDIGFLKGQKNYEYPYFLKNIIQKGDVCIDLGANLGYISVLLSKLVGKKGKVHAVEPVKPIRSVLQKNTRSLKNVEIYPYALGRENKKIKLGNDTMQNHGYIASGSHFILDENVTENKSAETEFDAEMKRGSELFENLSRLDFIKCDIEGYEVVVLTEMEPIILKHKPMLLIETRGENRKELLNYFKQHHFRTYVLEGEQLKPTDGKGSWDILVVPEEKLDKIKPYIQEK